MEATKATVYIHEARVQLDDAKLAELNAVLADVPVMDRYSDGEKIKGIGYRLVPTLSIEGVIIKPTAKG